MVDGGIGFSWGSFFVSGKLMKGQDVFYNYIPI